MLSLIFLFSIGITEGEGMISAKHAKPIQKDYFEGWTAPVEPRQTLQNERSEAIEYIKLLWGKDAETMIKIVQCESNFSPKAINWGDARITGFPSIGLAQINAPYNEKLFDWKYNLDVAFEMYSRRSFQPWSCYVLLKN